LSFASAVVAGTATIFVSGLVLVDAAYNSPSLHVSLETAAAIIAIVAALLLHGRFSQSHAQNDLVLFYAFALFAVSNFAFSALPAAFARSYPDGVATWAPAVASVLAAGLLCAAARTDNAPIAPARRRLLDGAAAAAILVVVIAASVCISSFGNPPSASPRFSPGTWSLDVIEQHPELILQGLVSALFFTAGVLFTKRAEETSDELLKWLAAGSIVAGFARLNYFFFPTLYSNWIYTGDILRVAFYVLLFVGAAREVASYQNRVAHAAVLEERRRMARDLHDGLTQELAYISAQTKRLAALTSEIVGDQVPVDHLVTAAERALDESRRAIAALTKPIDLPFHLALTQEAEEVAARIGVHVQLDIDETIQAEGQTRETLLRIVREAVTNAARHGEAGQISIRLSNGHGLHLEVKDDGKGFDPVERRGGFGLESMRERAIALGGEFRLASSPGHGTEIMVVLP
jgi:signal transduction histidine kinase